MIINGIKYLDNNSYTCIKINQDPNNKRFIIDINGTDENNIKSDYSVSNYIKKICDYKKVIAIIEYYINTSNISYMEKNNGINIIDGTKRLEIVSYDERVNNYLSNLELKYKTDRDNFLNNTDCYKYSICYSDKYTTYKHKHNRVELYLLKDEKDFLISFIHSKLKTSKNNIIYDNDYKTSELIGSGVSMILNGKEIINDVKFLTYDLKDNFGNLKIGGKR